MASSTVLGLGLLVLLLVPGTPFAAAEDPLSRGPSLTAESAQSGKGFVKGLPEWAWRPGHAELIRWSTARRGVGRAGRSLWRRLPDGSEEEWIPAEALTGAVPDADGGPLLGIGRAGAPGAIWTPDGRHLLVVERGHLLWFDLAQGTPADAPPRGRLLQRPPGAITDLRIAPDGSALAFAHDWDLWTVSTQGGAPRRLTHGGTEVVRRATLDWLYPEELGHDQAHWWSPDGRRIAFLEMDQGDVPTFSVPAFGSLHPVPEVMRYPKAGEANPRVRLGVIDAAGAGAPRWIDLGTPAPEYLVRVAWVPDGRRLLVVTLDRAQQLLQLHLADAQTGTSRVVRTERSHGWIDAPPAPHFVDRERFLWSSARDGDPAWWVLRVVEDGVQDVERLTAPADEVARRPHLDPTTGAAFVERRRGGVRRPWRRTAWAAPWVEAEVGAARDQDVDLDIADTGTQALVTRSAWNAPPVLSLARLDAANPPIELGRAALPAFATLRLAEPLDGEIALPPEVGDVRRPDGQPAVVRWRLWRPAGLAPGDRLPVIVDAYGGPGSRQLGAGWSRTTLWATFLAARGFLLLHADGRGSGGQGVAFQHLVREALGLAEIEDQARVVRHVAHLPYVDAERVGIFGWSFGGTMVVLAMTRHPDVFRCGVAVAPVTDWRLYDTIYTERYMGTPAANPVGYDATAGIQAIGRLVGPLLIVHGLADDNVHAQNTLQLVAAALKAKRTTLDTMLYPDVGHGLGGARQDMVRRQLEWFERHLK